MFTLALAAFTYRLWKATERLWQSAENQLTEFRNSLGTQAQTIANVQTEHMAGYVAAMIESNAVSRDNLTATQTAAETAVKQFNVGHRPWIPPQVSPAGEIAFDADKMSIPVYVVMQNTGSLRHSMLL